MKKNILFYAGLLACFCMSSLFANYNQADLEQAINALDTQKVENIILESSFIRGLIKRDAKYLVQAYQQVEKAKQDLQKRFAPPFVTGGTLLAMGFGACVYTARKLMHGQLFSISSLSDCTKNVISSIASLSLALGAQELWQTLTKHYRLYNYYKALAMVKLLEDMRAHQETA